MEITKNANTLMPVCTDLCGSVMRRRRSFENLNTNEHYNGWMRWHFFTTKQEISGFPGEPKSFCDTSPEKLAKEVLYLGKCNMFIQQIQITD